MITIKHNKKNEKKNEYEVKITCTLGAIYALKQALEDREIHSIVAGELNKSLNTAMENLDICSFGS